MPSSLVSISVELRTKNSCHRKLEGLGGRDSSVPVLVWTASLVYLPIAADKLHGLSR